MPARIADGKKSGTWKRCCLRGATAEVGDLLLSEDLLLNADLLLSEDLLSFVH